MVILLICNPYAESASSYILYIKNSSMANRKVPVPAVPPSKHQWPSRAWVFWPIAWSFWFAVKTEKHQRRRVAPEAAVAAQLVMPTFDATHRVARATDALKR
ncbi:MAG: hypothetical protein JZU64_06970 [Rhodoferax sp.]|nr:hypothetical protein [Rhodoferax sp.]